MLTFYTVETADGSVEYKARTEVKLSEASLNKAFELHAEKIGTMERKLIKDQAEIIAQENV